MAISNKRGGVTDLFAILVSRSIDQMEAKLKTIGLSATQRAMAYILIAGDSMMDPQGRGALEKIEKMVLGKEIPLTHSLINGLKTVVVIRGEHNVGVKAQQVIDNLVKDVQEAQKVD